MAAAIATSLPLTSPRVRAQAGRRMGWALLLTLALLFSQFLGLLHGIAHAGWPVSLARTAQASANAALFNYFDDADADSAHSDDAAAGKSSSQSLSQSSFSQPLSQLSTHAHAQHDKHHSCVEYDAAAGAAGIHVRLFTPPLIPGVQVLALWQAFASWDAPVVCHFSSRAPPR